MPRGARPGRRHSPPSEGEGGLVWPTEDGCSFACCSNHSADMILPFDNSLAEHARFSQALFGKTADSLERSTENEDEYMIHEREVLIKDSGTISYDLHFSLEGFLFF